MVYVLALMTVLAMATPAHSFGFLFNTDPIIVRDGNTFDWRGQRYDLYGIEATSFEAGAALTWLFRNTRSLSCRSHGILSDGSTWATCWADGINIQRWMLSRGYGTRTR